MGLCFDEISLNRFFDGKDFESFRLGNPLEIGTEATADSVGNGMIRHGDSENGAASQFVERGNQRNEADNFPMAVVGVENDWIHGILE